MINLVFYFLRIMIWICKLLEVIEILKHLRIYNWKRNIFGNNILLFHDTKSYNKVIIIIYS